MIKNIFILCLIGSLYSYNLFSVTYREYSVRSDSVMFNVSYEQIDNQNEIILNCSLTNESVYPIFISKDIYFETSFEVSLENTNILNSLKFTSNYMSPVIISKMYKLDKGTTKSFKIICIIVEDKRPKLLSKTYKVSVDYFKYTSELDSLMSSSDKETISLENEEKWNSYFKFLMQYHKGITLSIDFQTLSDF